MSSLLATLSNAANSLAVYEKALTASQNNINNALTPGYARQTAQFAALPYSADSGLLGGVTSTGLRDSRDQYAEAAVRAQVSAQGDAAARSGVLGSLESLFDVTGKSGVPAALSSLFAAFSAWSASPASDTARQGVLDAAADLAGSFNQTARSLTAAAADLDSQISTTVSQINTLGQTLARLNEARNGGNDAGLDAQFHQALEDLSALTDVEVITQNDGTRSVLIGGGRTPLVIGDQAYALSDAAAASGSFASGRLHGLLSLCDSTLPGSLDTLARSLADKVNGVIADAGGPPLFTFDPDRPAASLALGGDATAAGLPAASAGPPPVSNGTALALASLRTSEDAVGGQSFLGFWSGLASGIGAGKRAADSDRDRAEQLVVQTRAIRQEASGVSLDEEAARILEIQKGYQAISQLISILNELSDSVFAMMR